MSAKKRRALETVSVPRDEKHQPTVVSSADGAKVLKELDTTKEKYENQSNRTNTFLGDVAKALGAERHGSASEYATFETKNGRIVTIRLANHNAKVSNFDNRDESEGISIVVSPKKSEGMTNDGAAHVVEYYYDAIRLRRAEGKPLADILRSIKQALYSGEFTDTTGLAERQEVNADDVVRYNKVYHGSGADFDHFDHSHMGEGEGAQAYGWGTYVTEVEGIGRTYADTGFFHAEDRRAERSETPLGKVVDAIIGQEKYNSTAKNFEQRKAVVIENLERVLSPFAIWFERKDKKIPAFYRDDVEEAQAELDILRTLTEEQYNEERMKQGRVRHLYTVEIPDDTGSNYLKWDKRLSRGQIETIREGLAHMMDSPVLPDDFKEKLRRLNNGYDPVVNITDGSTGRQVYETIGDAILDSYASKFLSSLGFVGIKYPADYRRGGNKEGKQNYVIFDEKDARITDHVRFFRTPSGEAYGFTVGGKIYIDPRIADSETPIHEYAHLWATAMKNGNPKEWQNVVGLMKGTTIWDEVKRRYPELETDDELADEVLATYSGRRGAERLREEMRKAADGSGSVTEKAEAVGALERVRRALQKFWKAVADMLHIHYTSAEEVADRVMKDLLDGVDPRGLGVDESVRADFSPYLEYRKLAGEVEARNVQSRMGMTPEERRQSLARETEDVAREDQIFLYGSNGVDAMGSRVDKKMEEIGRFYEGKGLSDEVRAIVDVFSGKKKRQTVSFTDKEGTGRKMIFSQGHDLKAGSKHAIFRHLNDKSSRITIGDIAKIHNVLNVGERVERKDKVTYSLETTDGVKYTLASELDKRGNETFVSFYTNRKASTPSSQNTQLSAQAHDADASLGANLDKISEL